MFIKGLHKNKDEAVKDSFSRGRGGRRRLPIGAEWRDGGVDFRTWAPARSRVSVAVEGVGEYELAREESGYFSGFVPDVGKGARYRFRLDGEETLYPDPASRYQPEGPHGASEIVDPLAFRWSDADWKGISLRGQIVYEMHVGTFTPEGSWAAAAEKLPLLKSVGISVVEMMPVADFAGEFGWGYDGVDFFAPTRLYGMPDDLRAFVDRAHALGLGVILDVVYNHFGPDGCHLRAFTPDYFTDTYKTDWGEAVNYDGENAAGVRAFMIANARLWIEEFHFDGLRLDATQTIYDNSPDHILAELAREARKAADGRSIILIAENEDQDARLTRAPEAGGFGLDAVWNDDFHHSAVVALTGHDGAYYSDYRGLPQEFVSAAKYGYLFQGQHSGWQHKARGAPALDVAPERFVCFSENHDQIANSVRGQRLHQMTSPGHARALAALVLLLPATPMLFQGQEFWASAPFAYFADHHAELAPLVRQGRRAFLAQFPHIAAPGVAVHIPDPEDKATFLACKLDWSERERRQDILALHRDLIALRKSDPVFAAQAPRALDGAVIAGDAFLLRYFGEAEGDRLVIVNFGRDFNPKNLPDPLAAPPHGEEWRVLWSSEAPPYGGSGTAAFSAAKGWHIAGHSTLVLTSR
jgi:maltooligosyltrehalose trehalohydrolase